MNNLTENPQTVMARHGKSFYFASLIFSHKSFIQVSRLYAFCRYVDDCADELHPTEARKALNEIRLTLENTQHSSLLQNYISQLEAFGIDRNHMHDLLLGAEFDISEHKVLSESDLERYCYLVAGVVGLMMCPLIEVKNSQAHPYAVALGIGMQMTNICRDVLEDAQRGRIYLPSMPLSLETLATQGTTPQILKKIIQERLNIADQYYIRAYRGLAYIPLRARFCILIAGEIYRSIGVKIKKNDFNVLTGRTYLNLFEKILVVLKAIPKTLHPRFWSVTA